MNDIVFLYTKSHYIIRAGKNPHKPEKKRGFPDRRFFFLREICAILSAGEKGGGVMIRVSNIRIPATMGEGGLWPETARRTGAVGLRDGRILKKSVDARKKKDVCLIYTVAFAADNEDEVLRRTEGAEPWTPEPAYEWPARAGGQNRRPVIVVGMGPAGLFAAYALCRAGVSCVLLEQGKDVERRTEDVARFWRTGELDETSNVQFGEGGAGTFSDGKLTCGTGDRRIPAVLRLLADFGAPRDILWLAKPHIGTDKLKTVVANMREWLMTHGCLVRFETKLTGLITENGRIAGVTAENSGATYELPAAAGVLCPGNAARDTFAMLKEAGVKISAKPFSVGVRIEHGQETVDRAQYGKAATLGTLPHSDYKLAVHLPEGRSVYTFCVCPGGYVVAASSESGGVVTNGMSEYARDNENICGGLLVSVTPEDFGGDPFRAVAFQRELESAAFRAGGGTYAAPAQLVGDFLQKKASNGCGKIKPTYKPDVKWGNLWGILPDFVCEALAEALPQMGRKIRGFDDPDAVLTAVETRSSCPLRMDRDDEGEAIGLPGLFPCGEGAGYAGGIVSSALDGMRAAEAVCRALDRDPSEFIR